MSLISLSHISKIYQSGEVEVKALDDISFEVEKGEFVAIMGPSGSGKSTLMHILGLLDRPSSGKYYLEEMDTAKFSDEELAKIRNKKIGFVFQFFNLLPRTSALRNVMVPMIYGGVKPEEREKRARELLEAVGLGERLYHTSSQLSGGEQQRVAIARALAMNPAIILADEPTGNIATNQAQEVMKIFQKLNKEGHTIVLITHEPDIAEYAKRIIHLRDGKIIKDELNGRQRKIPNSKHQIPNKLKIQISKFKTF
jgi:putative ABC transport system ATP-binding protein